MGERKARTEKRIRGSGRPGRGELRSEIAHGAYENQRISGYVDYMIKLDF